jgi:hypothetical protein
MSARRSMVVMLATVYALVSALVFASTPAFAERAYVPGVSFGGPGSGPGQLSEPVGVAVNDSSGLEPDAGDVYVVDAGNNRVERFSATGAYLGQFNGSGEFEVEGKEVKHAPNRRRVRSCTRNRLRSTIHAKSRNQRSPGPNAPRLTPRTATCM